MRFPAALFDLDGTLLDTLEDLADSMNETLRRLGRPGHPADAYRRFVGDGVRNLVLRALPEGSRDEETVARGVEILRVEYRARLMAKTRPYPGVPEMLGEIAARGVRAAVLSNKPDALTREIVARLLPGASFEAVRGARPGVPRKPDPGSALDLARGMGVPPSEFLYLGDTNTDMRTANAAGMYAVGALWGFRDEAELRESGAREVVAAPAEVARLF